MTILKRNDYKPKSKFRSGERRSRSRRKANAEKVRHMVVRGVSSELARTFRALKEKGREVDKLPEYLEALRGVLEKPLPDQEEVERLVPPGLAVWERYEDLMERLGGDMPEDGESRRVYARVAAGPEYDDFREKAEETLERIDLFERTVEGSKIRGSPLTLTMALLVLRLRKRKGTASTGK